MAQGPCRFQSPSCAWRYRGHAQAAGLPGRAACVHLAFFRRPSSTAAPRKTDRIAALIGIPDRPMCPSGTQGEDEMTTVLGQANSAQACRAGRARWWWVWFSVPPGPLPQSPRRRRWGATSRGCWPSPEISGPCKQEADAAAQRIGPAGALPDPVLRVELMNINNYGNDASPSLLPWKVGETKYTLMQALPLWGKRELQARRRRRRRRTGRRQARRHLGRTGCAHQGHLRRVLPRGGQRAAGGRSAGPDGAPGAGCAGPLCGWTGRPAGRDPRPAGADGDARGADRARQRKAADCGPS
jgi:hypothetical protein